MLIAREARRGRRFRCKVEVGVVVVGFEVLVVCIFVGDVVGVVWLIGVNWEVSDTKVECDDCFALGRERWSCSVVRLSRFWWSRRGILEVELSGCLLATAAS